MCYGKMTPVDNNVGTTLIKHYDKWRGAYYLKDDLSFTPKRSQAALFYLLKSGDTEIINGDRISINCGNKVLTVSPDNTLRLIDRDQIHRQTKTFTLTNGTDDITPVTHESELYIVSDRTRKMALKYQWDMESSVGDITVPNHNVPNSVQDLSTVGQWPAPSPKLASTEIVPLEDPDIRLFLFSFEAAEKYTESTPDVQICAQEPSPIPSKWWEWFESVKGPLFIVLLMVVLVLIILTTQ